MTHTQEPRKPVLRVAGVSKRYGKRRVLDDLDLTVTPGSITTLMGANGSGKTTLMRLLLGTLTADDGHVEVLGLDPLRHQAEVLRQVGFVPSVPDVYDWMTAKDLFEFLAPQYPTWDRAFCAELCSDLAVPLDTKFSAMSRGEGMKAMLTAALTPQPELLLLDEPFGGLDPMVRDEVIAGVVTNLREAECTVLCATHDLEVAARIADRVAFLADGRIARHDSMEAILDLDAGPTIPAALKQALVETTQASAQEVSV